MVENPVDQESEHYDVFLSHSHEDAELVEAIAHRLVDEYNFEVWLDKWVLVPGESWQPEMAKGLNVASCCIVFIGGNTPDGWFQQEIQRALNRQASEPGFRVIPVLLPGSDPSHVEDFLELRTWVDFRSGIDDEWIFHTFISGIQGVPPGRPVASVDEGISDEYTNVSKRLKDLRKLREELLIDEIREAEYERKILDVYFGIEP